MSPTPRHRSCLVCLKSHRCRGLAGLSLSLPLWGACPMFMAPGLADYCILAARPLSHYCPSLYSKFSHWLSSVSDRLFALLDVGSPRSLFGPGLASSHLVLSLVHWELHDDRSSLESWLLLSARIWDIVSKGLFDACHKTHSLSSDKVFTKSPSTGKRDGQVWMANACGSHPKRK